MAGWTVRLGRLCMLALALLNAVPALAGNPPGPAASAPADSSEAAWAAARQAAQEGPRDIALLNQATLKLPAGRVFIPQPQATRLLQAMGNPGEDPRLQGLIFPAGDQGWFMTVRFAGRLHQGRRRQGLERRRPAEELPRRHRSPERGTPEDGCAGDGNPGLGGEARL